MLFHEKVISHLVLARPPSYRNDISTTSTSNVYDNFEQMLMRAESYRGNRLQSDTLKDLEGTLALAQEIKGIPRTEQYSSFLNFADLVSVF